MKVSLWTCNIKEGISSLDPQYIFGASRLPWVVTSNYSFKTKEDCFKLRLSPSRSPSASYAVFPPFRLQALWGENTHHVEVFPQKLFTNPRTVNHNHHSSICAWYLPPRVSGGPKVQASDNSHDRLQGTNSETEAVRITIILCDLLQINIPHKNHPNKVLFFWGWWGLKLSRGHQRLLNTIFEIKRVIYR